MDKFDVIVENAVLQAKTTILEEAAGTPAGERYIYIVEAAGDVLKKAKEIVKNNKGKLAALAGVAALGGAGYYAHEKGYLGDVERGLANAADKVGLDNVAEKLKQDAADQDYRKNVGYLKDAVDTGDPEALKKVAKYFGSDAALGAQYVNDLKNHRITPDVTFDQWKEKHQK